MSQAEEDVAFKLLHTADWHLGHRFRGFDDADESKLTRERLNVVARILQLAHSRAVDAVVCAGDLFDTAQPTEEWWRGLASVLLEHARPERPVFLLPGNHDPLRTGTVWSPEHPFRRLLPSAVQVVDRDDFSHEFSRDAVLYAVPCRSQAGQDDLTQKLPARAAGDERVRIGLVHGQTFDLERHQSNFPISRTAAHERGFDYLAIGDTHGFRRVDTGTPTPVVYPGTPEQLQFDEVDAGYVALVFFPRRPRAPLIQRERVGRYEWVDATIHSIEDLRRLRNRPGLERSVLRVALDLEVTLEEELELERLLAELRGSSAASGRAAAVWLERRRVEIGTGDLTNIVGRLPPVLQHAVRLLQAQAASTSEHAAPASRALKHLYQLVRREFVHQEVA
jgi:DNA repair exonuclease SbcCD nuclease subunit